MTSKVTRSWKVNTIEFQTPEDSPYTEVNSYGNEVYALNTLEQFEKYLEKHKYQFPPFDQASLFTAYVYKRIGFLIKLLFSRLFLRSTWILWGKGCDHNFTMFFQPLFEISSLNTPIYECYSCMSSHWVHSHNIHILKINNLENCNLIWNQIKVWREKMWFFYFNSAQKWNLFYSPFAEQK